jgi:hypothetical protein
MNLKGIIFIWYQDIKYLKYGLNIYYFNKEIFNY